jgi:hypothetical protein
MVSCPSVQKFTTMRHNSLVRIAKNHFDMMNAYVIQEPYDLFANKQTRPDIRIDIGNVTYLLDFCVTHPACASNISAACDHPLGAADQAEKRKNTKYAADSALIHAEFIPIIFETFGAVGKSAQRFLDLAHRFSASNSFVISQHEIMSSLRSSLACTLQKGNAMIAKQYLVRASKQDGDGHVTPSKPRTPPRKPRKRLSIQTALHVDAMKRSAARALSLNP